MISLAELLKKYYKSKALDLILKYEPKAGKTKK